MQINPPPEKQKNIMPASEVKRIRGASVGPTAEERMVWDGAGESERAAICPFSAV
jgi:hypothetical protein